MDETRDLDRAAVIERVWKRVMEGREEEPPLADLPEDDVPLADLPEEDVPLAEVPETGDAMALYSVLSALSGLGLVCLNRRKKEEE